MFYFANFVSKVETKKLAIIIMKDMAQMSKNVIVHQENSSLPQANRDVLHIFLHFSE